MKKFILFFCFINVFLFISQGSLYADSKLIKREIAKTEKHIEALTRTFEIVEDPKAKETLQSSIFQQEEKLASLKQVLSKFTLKLPWIFELSTGYQSLGYQEHSSYFNVNSDVQVKNIVLNTKIEYAFRENQFMGIKSTLPISKNKSQEKWWYSDKLFQTNDFDYGQSMIDLYSGYNFTKKSAFYGGAKFYLGEQLRNNLYVVGKGIVNLEAKETVTAFGLMGGIRGENEYDIDLPSWIYGGELEVFLPLYVNTTNSISPVPIGGSGGYILGSLVKGGYHFNKDWNLELQARYSITHWNRGFYDGGTFFIEWPQNDTQNFSVVLAFKSFI